MVPVGGLFWAFKLSPGDGHIVASGGGPTHLPPQGYFIHASPTLYNAGASRQQLASSFLVAMKDDSIDGVQAPFVQVARYVFPKQR